MGTFLSLKAPQENVSWWWCRCVGVLLQHSVSKEGIVSSTSLGIFKRQSNVLLCFSPSGKCLVVLVRRCASQTRYSKRRHCFNTCMEGFWPDNTLHNWSALCKLFQYDISNDDTVSSMYMKLLYPKQRFSRLCGALHKSYKPLGRIFQL